MEKKYSDNEIRDILGTASIENKIVDARIAETLASLRQSDKVNKISAPKQLALSVGSKKHGKKKSAKAWRKIVYGLGTVAAVLLVSFGICVTNPSLAAGIPILGSIFAKVQEVFPFGKMPEDETNRLYHENVATDRGIEENSALDERIQDEGKTSSGSAKNDNSAFQVTNDGLTVTFTEYYASNQAIYFGVHIKNEEEFPEFASMGDTGYQLLQADTSEDYSFREDLTGGRRNIEGRLEDAHTFVGIMRVDYDEIKVDGRRYDKACEEAEAKGDPLPEVTAQNRDSWFDEYEIPDTFHLDMTIDCFHGYCTEEAGGRYRKQGEWSYSFDLSRSSQDVRTIQVDEVNEQGVGIDSLEISPVELTVHVIEPINCLTFAVILDKDGRKLTSGGSNAYELATAGHDISTVTIYVCDYDEYMDEIKAYALEDDDAKFRSVLEERALFQKTIDTQK